MDLVLYPRAAQGDRIRVWIGAFQATAAPALSWFLDGVATQPVALRPISSARPDELLPENPETIPRVFTGVYEFTGLAPDSFHRISVEADGVAGRLDTRTLPNSVPAEIDRWFNVLLVSCHHAAEDRGGLSGIIVSKLKAVSEPHLTILAGDQVYLGRTRSF
ncbi:MAG: hypothetical protein AABO57_13510 [Acidobacteriota bacterium]